MNRDDLDIRKSSSIEEIVVCVESEIYGDAPVNTINYFNALPSTAFFDYLRVLSVPYLFNLFEEKIRTSENPVEWFPNELKKLQNHIERLIQSPFPEILEKCFVSEEENAIDEEVKSYTGIHYGKLFKNFNNWAFFVEAQKLLELRLQRNNIHIPHLENLVLLDQGCGGGRYSAAWKMLGVGKVVGLDYSLIGMEDARQRITTAGLKDISFDHGSVLDLPYDKGSFDIVFSNGVLHHSENWKKGLSEMLRVLKSGGYGWLYLIENPGGLFWDKIEILRAIMKNVNKEFAQNILTSFNIPANRIFYMLDHVKVPINTRLNPDQIESELRLNGAISINRLKRGTDFDRIEQLHNNVPYAKEKFGIGENRYFFQKN